MSTPTGRPHPALVPTLTEVIDLSRPPVGAPAAVVEGLPPAVDIRRLPVLKSVVEEAVVVDAPETPSQSELALAPEPEPQPQPVVEPQPAPELATAPDLTVPDLTDLDVVEVVEAAPIPVPPEQVPVLVDVAELDTAPLDWQDAADLALQPQPQPEAQPQPVQEPAVPTPVPQPTIDEAQLTQRVLSDVQRQIDGMLEFRLREALGPILARHTEALASELREELNRTMRDVVLRSVAQELARMRQR